ncbi:MAG: alpha/beta fold hydrolase [Anaerolineaceae bacterium]|nr:alpha/beta fold hydrolase [Anaerolineaceae bacterium]
MHHLIIPTAEPFFFAGDKIGCLLVHGFTGSPKEMRLMGKSLNEKGVTVLGIRLAGHATEINDLPRTHWQDWLASVEDGINILKGNCEYIFVAGLSMGGLLALFAAALYPINGAIAMSTPYSISVDWRVKLAKPLSFFVPFIDKGESDMVDKKTLNEHVDYHAYPTRSIAELNKLINCLHNNLEDIHTPILFINSKKDKTVPINQVDKYINQIPSKNIEHLILKKSGHVVTEDIEREVIFNTSFDFIKKFSK